MIEYIEKTFGVEKAKNLQRIRTGGDNNRKGDSFEAYYAAAKVCDLMANKAGAAEYILSAQEFAFVDDLCLKHEPTKYKENYQAKNSSGDAASWTSEIEERFRMQKQIDTDFHGYSESRQILLVSSENKATSNTGKIPEDMKNSCSSEFFPYGEKPTQVLYMSEKLRADLEKICGTGNLSVLDVAYRCVLSAWIGSNDPRSIEDIIGEAKALSKPDVFGALVDESPLIPDWIHSLCMTFPGLASRVESGKFIVGYNGFEISLSAGSSEPSQEALRGLSDIGEVIGFLMSMAVAELDETTTDTNAGGSQ